MFTPSAAKTWPLKNKTVERYDRLKNMTTLKEKKMTMIKKIQILRKKWIKKYIIRHRVYLIFWNDIRVKINLYNNTTYSDYFPYLL